ncbi:hypothetical protein CERZMDRAFT_101893 [Cercospora zeae-maydis SCOH1-5]|uniref:Uncharacterized protein n=1 Tax=Cercospora zeae-maydis SCOH1-5 TaxID=717836 RepID=A0A6A6F084_9PEZI|nr:hypothetical protein CERZMDRAFT_101893 [Cercospora zeae-maydis SCOH1-5]
MGCCETGHSHAWPTDGVLVIQRCEVRCNFCTGAKATKPWKYAWFLRRHVRAIHCKPGKGENYDLQVSTQWKAPVDSEQTDKTPKKSKSKGNSIKAEAEYGDEEEDASERAKPGAYSMGKSADTIWIPQPIYLDVPNQFPGMNRGFHPLDHRDVRFDQTLAFGDQDVDVLVDAADVNSLLNDESIGQWLASNLRGAIGNGDRLGEPSIKKEDESSPTKMEDIPEVGEDRGDYARLLGSARHSKEADAVAMQSAAFFDIGEDGEDIRPGPFLDEGELRLGDRFFMPQDADPADIDTFWASDDALVQVSTMANIFNTARPHMTSETMEMMRVLEATTGVMREHGVGSKVMSRTYGQFARMLAQRGDSEDESFMPPIDTNEDAGMDIS